MVCVFVSSRAFPYDKTIPVEQRYKVPQRARRIISLSPNNNTETTELRQCQAFNILGGAREGTSIQKVVRRYWGAESLFGMVWRSCFLFDDSRNIKNSPSVSSPFGKHSPPNLRRDGRHRAREQRHRGAAPP